MNIWNILGIDATADCTAITAAYHAKLSGANPEDHPEEFKQLRAAYEQALSLAKQAAAADASGGSEADRWIADANEIYQDIHRRCSPAEWTRLLEEDFCARPANRIQARDRLLGYLANHYLLPHPVWVLLDEHFGLQQSAEELRGLFPPAFIDNIILPGIKHGDQIDFSLLDGGDGTACDEYLRACSQCLRATSSLDMDQAKTFLSRMEATGVRHPCTGLCRARISYFFEKFEDAEQQLKEVLEQTPRDSQALLLHAQLSIRRQDYTRAEQDLRQILEIAPDLAQARYDLIGCLEQAGRLQEAKTACLDLLRDLPYNRLVYQALIQLNTKLLPQLDARYQACPEDTENSMELAWTYHQMGQEDKANAILSSLPAEIAGTADYENLSAKIKLNRREWDAALVHLRAWESALREHDSLERPRLPEALHLQACVYHSLGDKEKSLAMLEQIADQWPGITESRRIRAQFLLQDSRLHEALQSIQQYQKEAPSDPAASYLCGEILFQMHQLQASFNAFNDAMSRIGGRDAACLLYQCRILMVAGQWKEAKELLDQLAAADIKDPMLEYCLAQWAGHERRNEEALEHYKALLPACRGENPPDFAGEVFFRLVALQYKALDAQEKLRLVDEGLRHDPGSVSLLDMKVDILRESNNIPATVDTCRELCRLYPTHPTAFETLGRLLQFRLRDFAGAAQAYKTQLSIREGAILHNLLGICLQELEQYAEAEEQLQHAVQASPQCAAYLGNLAELYLVQNRLDEAEKRFRQALTLSIPRQEDRIWLRRRLAITLRRAGRYSEAVEALEPNIKQEYIYSDLCLQAQTWAQAGDPQRALQVLHLWQTLAAPAEESYWQEEAAVLQQMGRMGSALHDLRRGADTSRECRANLGNLYLSLERYRQGAEIFAVLCAESPEKDHLWDRLARCLFFSGDRKGAAEAATRGLACLEKNRSLYNKAMYYTRQAAFLICRGEHKQAAAALEEAERSPLCSQCSCPVCKDAIGLRVILLELDGKFEQAAQLCQDSMQRFPDELDFTVFYKRIRKKIGRKT